MLIHVAGPVIPRGAYREVPTDLRIARVYEQLSERLGNSHDLNMPFRRPDIDHLSDEDFTRFVRASILAADMVVSIYAGDAGTIAETTVAAMESKPVLLFPTVKHVTRIVAGFPTVRIVDSVDMLVKLAGRGTADR
jgi:hypothetical protein